LAESATFFSFGTNDLTQTAMALSRDDSVRFLPAYVDQSQAAIFKAHPFESLDIEGVGQLVRMGIERGRASRRDLKIGVCGEHGGEADSIRFFHSLGMDYVSCSPYRVPIARLAAAQAAIESDAAEPPARGPIRRTGRRKAKRKPVRKSKARARPKAKAGRPRKNTRRR
jgi:pyruvate,orthophosphate dikinase